MDNKLEELLKKHNIELSKRLYNRTSKDWGEYKVTEFSSYYGKTKAPYFKCRFKNTGHEIEAPLKTIINNEVKDIQQQKKQTKKKVRAKKKQAKVEKKQAKKFMLHFNEVPTLLSLDMSSYSTGYSIFKNGKLIKYGYLYQPKTIKHDTSRLNFMKTEIGKLIDEYGINCVALEDVILKHKYTLYVLSKLQGVIIDMLYERKIRYMLINPLEWKTDLNINRMRSDEFDSRLQSKDKTVKCITKDFGIDFYKEFADSPKDLSEPCVFDVVDSIGLATCALKRIISD